MIPYISADFIEEYSSFKWLAAEGAVVTMIVGSLQFLNAISCPRC